MPDEIGQEKGVLRLGAGENTGEKREMQPLKQQLLLLVAFFRSKPFQPHRFPPRLHAKKKESEFG
ncbi:MAG: hypothetical protein NWE94_08675 [Candidatus Bathyarchaeota archaeon]|nr:hypothetical protein [Candidatus Bathyarchaeota archaeon]